MKNKAVLVIDMPENCMNCRLTYDCMSCIVTGERFWNQDCFDPGLQVLHNCPLSPIPEKKNLKQYVDNTALNINGVLAYQYAQGWNNCIDDILEGDTK